VPPGREVLSVLLRRAERLQRHGEAWSLGPRRSEWNSAVRGLGTVDGAGDERRAVPPAPGWANEWSGSRS
jgi:hypothetical protein